MRWGKFKGTYLIQKTFVKVIEARMFSNLLHIIVTAAGYIKHTEEFSGINTLLISCVRRTCDVIRQTDLLVESAVLSVINVNIHFSLEKNAILQNYTVFNGFFS